MRHAGRPLISFAAQVIIIGVMIWKMDFLGAGLAFADWIVWINLAVLAIGVAEAFYLKSSDPKKYDQIGRLIYEGVPERP